MHLGETVGKRSECSCEYEIMHILLSIFPTIAQHECSNGKGSRAFIQEFWGNEACEWSDEGSWNVSYNAGVHQRNDKGNLSVIWSCMFWIEPMRFNWELWLDNVNEDLF